MKKHQLGKKIIAGFVCGVLVTVSTASVNLWGKREAVYAADTEAMRVGNTIVATLNISEKTLTIRDIKTASVSVEGVLARTWNQEKYRENIVTVKVMGSYSKAEDYLFYGLNNLTNVEFTNVQNPTSATGMFEGCSSLVEVDLSQLQPTSAISLKNMFKNCTSLKKVTGLGNLKASDLSGMFEGCVNLESVDLSGLNVSVGTDMTNMFKGCTKLTSLDCSGMNLEGITTATDVLSGCNNLQDVIMPKNVGTSILLPENGVWHSEDTMVQTSILAGVNQNMSYSTVQYLPTPVPVATVTPEVEVGTVTNSGEEDLEENFVNTGVYTDIGCRNLATAKESVLYVNGGSVKQTDGSRIDYKNKTYYTELKPTNIVTTKKNGKIVTKKGKIVVGITTDSSEPVLVKGRIVDKEAKKIARATISKGKIRVTAQKQGGTVYLWAKDTGDEGKSVCIRLTVRVAPSTLAIYNEKTDNNNYSKKTKQYKKDNIQVGSGSSIYLYPHLRCGRTTVRAEDATYSISTKGKWASCFMVEQDKEDPYHFRVFAKALNNGKKASATITIQCLQNGKRVTFKATAVNSIKEISFENPVGVALDKDNSVITITSSAIKKNQGNVDIAIESYQEDMAFTDTPKLYAMGSIDGFDEEKLKEGKIKITEKAKSVQRKMTAKVGKDKKTLTITIAKNVPEDVTIYYLLVYNTKSEENAKGYEIVTVSSAIEE